MIFSVEDSVVNDFSNKFHCGSAVIDFDSSAGDVENRLPTGAVNAKLYGRSPILMKSLGKTALQIMQRTVRRYSARVRTPS